MEEDEAFDYGNGGVGHEEENIREQSEGSERIEQTLSQNSLVILKSTMTKSCDTIILPLICIGLFVSHSGKLISHAPGGVVDLCCYQLHFLFPKHASVIIANPYTTGKVNSCIIYGLSFWTSYIPLRNQNSSTLPSASSTLDNEHKKLGIILQNLELTAAHSLLVSLAAS